MGARVKIRVAILALVGVFSLALILAPWSGNTPKAEAYADMICISYLTTGGTYIVHCFDVYYSGMPDTN